jgi:hypothetical protein
VTRRVRRVLVAVAVAIALTMLLGGCNGMFYHPTTYRWVSRLLSPDGRCSCSDVAGFVTARIQSDDFESCPGSAGA